MIVAGKAMVAIPFHDRPARRRARAPKGYPATIFVAGRLFALYAKKPNGSSVLFERLCQWVPPFAAVGGTRAWADALPDS